MRIFIAAVIFYTILCGFFDSVFLDGRYRKAVWQEASYQAKRMNAEVRSHLGSLGI